MSNRQISENQLHALAEGRKLLTKEALQRGGLSHIGKHHSEITKQKMRITRLRLLRENPCLRLDLIKSLLKCERCQKQMNRYARQNKTKYCRRCAGIVRQDLEYTLLKKQWSSLSPIFWSWLAGFYEGEGSLSYQGGHPGIQIGQKEKHNLDYIQQNLRIGHILFERQKPFYDYNVNRQAQVRLLLESILPYLQSPRRLKKIELVLRDISQRMT